MQNISQQETTSPASKLRQSLASAFALTLSSLSLATPQIAMAAVNSNSSSTNLSKISWMLSANGMSEVAVGYNPLIFTQNLAIFCLLVLVPSLATPMLIGGNDFKGVDNSNQVGAKGSKKRSRAGALVMNMSQNTYYNTSRSAAERAIKRGQGGAWQAAGVSPMRDEVGFGGPRRVNQGMSGRSMNDGTPIRGYGSGSLGSQSGWAAMQRGPRNIAVGAETMINNGMGEGFISPRRRQLNGRMMSPRRRDFNGRMMMGGDRRMGAYHHQWDDRRMGPMYGPEGDPMGPMFGPEGQPMGPLPGDWQEGSMRPFSRQSSEPEITGY